MLAPRGVTVAVVGATMWLVARIIGSSGPRGRRRSGSWRCRSSPAAFLRWTERRVSVKRQPLGWPRRPRHPRDGAARRGEPLLRTRLVPPARGPTPVRARTTRHASSSPGSRAVGPSGVSYTVLPQVRGRYQLGPLTVDVTDPFGLSRRRSRVGGRDELFVTPEIEDLAHAPDTASGPMVGCEPVPSAAADRRGLLHDAGLPGRRRPAADPLAVRRAHGRADDPPERSDETRDRPDLPRQPGSRDRPHAHRTVRTRGLVRGERRRAAPSQRLRPAAQHAGRPAGGHVRGPLHGCADDDGAQHAPGRSRPPSPISGPGPPRTRR